MNRFLLLFALAASLYSQTHLIGPVLVQPDLGTAAANPLQLLDASGTDTNAVSLQAPSAITTPYTLIFPGLISSNGCLDVTNVSGQIYDVGVTPCSGSAPTFPVDSTLTTNYNVLASDFANCKTLVVAGASITVTLVASGSQPANGQCVWVVNYGAGTVTVARNGQNLNGGTASLTLSAGTATAPTGAWIVSNGTDYVAEAFAGGSSGTVCGSNTDVLFNNSGSCGASGNLTFNSSGQVLTVTGISGDAAINVPVNSGFVQSGGGFLSNVSGGSYNAFQSNTDGAVLRAFGTAAIPSSLQTTTYPSPGSWTASHSYSLAQYILDTNGHIQKVTTAGTSYSVVPIWNYTGGTTSDGGSLVWTDEGSWWVNQGGYSDFALVTYPPSGTAPCFDRFGNLATQPIPLTGATFAVGDVLMWNGPSPLQGYVGGSPYHIDGTPCAAPQPLPVYDGVSNNTGLNIAAYIFPVGGLATDYPSYASISSYRGGVVAQSLTAAGLYNAGTVAASFSGCTSGVNCGTLTNAAYLGGYVFTGHSTGVPGAGSNCTSITSCTNPLSPGEGVSSAVPGIIYEEDSTAHLTVYNGSAWEEVVYFGDSPTFGTVTATEFSSTQTGTGSGHIAFQTNNTCTQIDGQGDISVACGGLVANNSTTGGYGAPNNAARNVYSTLGGFESTCSTGGNIVFSTSNNDFEVTCAGNATVNNLTINGTCTGCGGGTNYWTASGSNIYNNNTGFVGINQTSPSYQLDVGGTIDSSVTGSTLAFREASGNFEVDGNGNVSTSGSGGVYSANSSSGGFNVTTNTALNSIQTVGGFRSYTGGGGECTYVTQTYTAAYSNCNTSDIIWRLATSGTTGLLSLNDGSGSGGLDGAGGLVYMTATSGDGIIGATDLIYAGTPGSERSYLSFLGLGTYNTSNVNTFNLNAFNGVVSIYDEFATAGPGLTPVFYSPGAVSSAGNVGITATNMGSAVPPAGLYEVHIYITQPTATSGCAVQPSKEFAFAYYDPTGGPLQGFAFLGSLSTGLTTTSIFTLGTSVAQFNWVSAPVQLDGVHIPFWEVLNIASGTGCSNFGTYTVYISLVQVG